MNDIFTISKIGEQIYHLRFASEVRMADTMMRFEEYYESPVFAGKYFTREEFTAWYSEHKNGAEYRNDWTQGFNLPSSALAPFYAGHFSPLTPDESAVLEAFGDHKDEKFYIIATASDTSHDFFDHEIAHALYFLNPEYKKEVDAVLASVDIQPVRDLLINHPDYSEYHLDVLDDEVHAHLAHDSEELKSKGLSIEPYRDTIAKLQKIYQAYTPVRAGIN